MTSVQRHRAMKRRIARAEAEAHATILRAFAKVLRVLEREKLDLQIYLDRKQRGVIR